jgi:ribosome recycling factor
MRDDMNPNQVVDQAKTKFNQAVEHFQEELKKVRTGRAHPSMLDGLTIEAYGTPMPLMQVGSVSAPEAQLLQITPYDPSNVQAIVNAIRNNPSLDMNPSDDGKVVRVPIPPLTEERRREYVKLVGAKMEECMVTLRNIRHEAMKSIEQAKKDKEVGEDEAKQFEKRVDDAMAAARSNADGAAKAKESEIMTV